eukprot:CAMPEP_0206451518 /NCGR_PEP_ID=MMETSP0324_2-20121206/19392_1 /ASSEMBLY_ACC=CAM_ASM_000836 /TAXON_ID=2866 /ORGANISM="Crypthecodinium cohnii, Strain Seligo" /LENGTH=331 /DNA_ID=CAMNT_0053921421 /DNA_START=176 /DNA_END=1168 /DNA_ORIENTATION=+
MELDQQRSDSEEGGERKEEEEEEEKEEKEEMVVAEVLEEAVEDVDERAQAAVANGSAIGAVPLVEEYLLQEPPLVVQPAANGASSRSPKSAMDLAREVVLDADTGDVVEDGGGNAGSDPEDATAESTAAPTSPGSLQDLAFIRQRHHAAYQERELATAKREQELADQELAEKVAKEEELARKRQLEEDEELSRQLAQQLNPTAATTTTPSSFSPYQSQSYTRTAVETFSMDDGEIDDQYHQMEDGEVRRPMRTNYLDQLIPSHGGHGASHGVGTEMVTFPPLLNEYGDPREVGASFSMARGLPRSPLLTALVPIGCTVITLGVAGFVAMSW